MSVHQSRLTRLSRRSAALAAAALCALAAVMLVALIPVVYQDPDATPGNSAIGSLIFAAINLGFALLAVLGRQSRGALAGVAVGALAVGLLFLDGVAAFSSHSGAPWIELPLAWGVFAADVLAALTATTAAILHRQRAAPRYSGSIGG